MNPNNLTATYHTLDFNLLPSDKFAHFCFWLVEESGEYEDVEFYDGKADKQRDVIGYLNGNKTELDYFQCKRNKSPVFSLLKAELDELLGHINSGKIKKPRKIYFVLSTSASPEAKDAIKNYAITIGLPEPIFWEPVYLDKKIKKDKVALKNFFNISEEKEEKVPEVDVTGQIAYGTDDYRFFVVNNGEAAAIDCNIYLLGFAGEHKVSAKIDLKPLEQKEIKLGLPGDFMKLNEIATRELRLHFEYRDSKNNWYFSERLLAAELVPSHSFYRIKDELGTYKPAEELVKFTINGISTPKDYSPLRPSRDINYSYGNEQKILQIQIGRALIAVWKFNELETSIAFQEIAKRKIEKMIKNGIFMKELNLNAEAITFPISGFKAYQYVRDNVV